MRLFTRLYLPVLALWLVLLPSVATAGAISTIRVGTTFYPVSASGAFGAATDIALLAGRATPWIAGLSLGYQIGKFVIEGVDSSGVVVPLNVLPASMTQKPAANQTWSGWTYNATTKIWSPPSVVPSVVGYTLGTSPCAAIFFTVDALLSCMNTASYGGVNTWYRISPYPNRTDIFNIDFYPAQSGATGPYISSCPAGYSLSGSSCNLSNSALVAYPSDNSPTIIAKPDGSGFVLDSRDPDNTLAPVSIPPVIQSSGNVESQPTRTTIQPQTGGGLKVITERQVVNADGSISTYKQVADVDASGLVTSTTAANYPGGLSEQTAQTQALTSSASPSLQLPTDYNREATQQSIADELKAQGSNSDLLAGTSLSGADAVKAHYDGHNDANQIDDVLNGRSALPSLPNLLFPQFTSPACHPIGWTFQGHDVSFDICPHVPTIKSIAAWVLNLIAAAACFQMLMNFRATRLRA